MTDPRHPERSEGSQGLERYHFREIPHYVRDDGHLNFNRLYYVLITY